MKNKTMKFIPYGKFAIMDDDGQIAKDPNGHYQIYDSRRAAQSELNFYHSRGFMGRHIREGKRPPTPAQVRAVRELILNPEFMKILSGIKCLWDQWGLGSNPEESERLYNGLVSIIEAYEKNNQ